MQRKDSSELSLEIDQSNLDHRSSKKWNGMVSMQQLRINEPDAT